MAFYFPIPSSQPASCFRHETRGDTDKNDYNPLMTPWLFFLLAITGFSPIQGETPLPKFDDYQVDEQYHGKTASPVITNHDREFRTRLRYAAREKANFAGHYVVTVWGCGAACLMGAAIDAKTGKVYWIPFTICCWPLEVEKPLDFRLDSSLIVFTGSRGEQGGGVYYYKFDGRQFVLLRAIEKPQQDLAK
jgi:hypothetical protein